MGGNVPEAQLAKVTGGNCEVWFEPVSTAKAVRLRALRKCDVCTPNFDELKALCGDSSGDSSSSSASFSAPAIDELIRTKFAPLYPGCHAVVVTCGADGCVVWERAKRQDSSEESSIKQGFSRRFEQSEVGSCTHIRPVTPVKSVLNCSGAGDSLCGAAAAVRACGFFSLLNCVLVGMFAAEKALETESPVHPDLSAELRSHCLLVTGLGTCNNSYIRSSKL